MGTWVPKDTKLNEKEKSERKEVKGHGENVSKE